MAKKINKFSETVYFVESPKDDTVLLAIDLRTDGKIVRWFDTIKERAMKVGKIVNDDPKRFVFERAAFEGGGVYEFIPLTVTLYNKKVKDHILIPQKFSKKEEMTKAISGTAKAAW